MKAKIDMKKGTVDVEGSAQEINELLAHSHWSGKEWALQQEDEEEAAEEPLTAKEMKDLLAETNHPSLSRAAKWWRPDEIDFLKRHKEKPRKWLARCLQRPEKGVFYKLKRLEERGEL